MLDESLSPARAAVRALTYADEAELVRALVGRAGLGPGAEVEITEEDVGIRLQRVAAGPRLVRIGRRRVARPTVPADQRPRVDIAAIVEDERKRWQ